MNLNDCFLLGTIVKVHGFKGQLSVKLSKGIAEIPQKMEQLYLETNGKLVPFFVTEWSQNGEMLLLKFEDIDSDTEAKKWLRLNVFIQKNLLPKIKKDVFQPQKYIDFKVFDIENTEIGVIDMVYDIPNNQLFAIAHPSGKEILVPANQDFVSEIDTKSKKIIFDFPDGLLEIYLSEERIQDSENE